MDLFEPKKMKVALYARVSLDETDPEKKQYQEPENQLQPLRDWAKALDYEVEGEFVDRASGADATRPEFRKMLALALQRRFSGILIWKLDRFSREGILPTMSYVKQLKDRGIFLKSLTESWLDTTNESMTELFFAFTSWASAEERRKISERTKAGIQRLKNIGQWKGGRPKSKKQEEVNLFEDEVKL